MCLLVASTSMCLRLRCVKFSPLDVSRLLNAACFLSLPKPSYYVLVSHKSSRTVQEQLSPAGVFLLLFRSDADLP